MITGNEPAMPHYKKQLTESVAEQLTDGGLTIRQYFAAMAMQGMVMYILDNHMDKGFEALAKDSISMANALITELNKEK